MNDPVMRLETLCSTLTNVALAAAQGELTCICLDIEIDQPRARYEVSEGLSLLEGALGRLAPHLGEQGRGPVPLAVNQARTALGGAIGLMLLEGTRLEGPSDLLAQLRLAVGHMQRARRAGAAVGSG